MFHINIVYIDKKKMSNLGFTLVLLETIKLLQA